MKKSENSGRYTDRLVAEVHIILVRAKWTSLSEPRHSYRCWRNKTCGKQNDTSIMWYV